jgi:hypothetical protein
MMLKIKRVIARIPGAVATLRAIRKYRNPSKRRDPAVHAVSPLVSPKSAKPAVDALIRLLKMKDLDRDIDLAVAALQNHQLTLAFLEAKRGNPRVARRLAADLDLRHLRGDILALARHEMADVGRADLATKGQEIVFARAHDPRNGARLAAAEYLRRAHDLYAHNLSIARVVDPKGYVVIFDLGSRITTGLMVPISLALMRKGYAVCSSVAATMPASDLPELGATSGMIRSRGISLTDEPTGSTTLHNKWDVDWDNGIVACDGINYFTFFLERISKMGKAYRAGITSPASERLFKDMLRRSDLALVLCKRLITLSATTGKPIRIVSMDTHFAPWGIVRRWCNEVGQCHGIHLVALSISYENYFSNLTSLEAGTISVEDMTARPDLRHPLFGGRERFDNYIEHQPKALRNRKSVLEWVKVDRSRTSTIDDSARSLVLNRIATAKASGRKVFAAFGKVLIDFAAPDDRGHVFRDFPEWIQFLVDTTTQKDALLIVKPHPHEIRPEIAMDGVQTMRDLLPKNLPENVIFLDHATFNSFELAEHIDAAFVWNGTIYCEFPILGKPAFAESIWAERDYPIDSDVVRTREEYEAILSGEKKLRVRKSTTDRATAYLQFMKSPEVAIPFKYVRRAGTNMAIGANEFYDDQLAVLEKDGDPWVDLAAERFFASEVKGISAADNDAILQIREAG